MPVIRDSPWHRERATSPLAQGLMLVFALVLLALACLSPWYLRPRERSRQTSCRANLKSLALATLTYAADCGRFPPAPAVARTFRLQDGMVATSPVPLERYFAADDWHRVIAYRSSQVFVCPSTQSIYSYEFDRTLYGAREERPSAQYEYLLYEAGFFDRSSPGPHNQHYNVTYCDGHADCLPDYDTVEKWSWSH